ncbi:AMP-binding protein [Nocardioides sp. YIM 152588]|uniref:AMP-binding protein n=1 Tax=Nocardioides sp. YIM 152588 TaxID=3158259 RepID=UPI0032E369FF
MSTPALAPLAEHWLLGGAADDAALVVGDRTITYGGLADRVAAARGTGPRRLTLLEATPTLEFVVAYLAALADGDPVLLMAPGDRERHGHLAAAYPPGSTEGLHEDLALLLSTSGSTGSPKLVRLSRDNVASNARSIADYLALRPGDVGITALPLHYCYGLSVLHSHLAAGATVVLTDLSVADACFWDLAERAGVTGVAGVPHTFALLDAVDFRAGVLPRLTSLRYLTQAGGRMAPDRVRSYVGDLGARGVDLFVMYGQTEATARMAYLPPHLALEHPDTIGVAIPGGALRVDPVDGAPDGCGELVYTGPNVMMGYAECLADLARGSELAELRTGDLARVTDAGLFQVLGRRDRHAKVLGHRVDLDRVESAVADAGRSVRLVARPEALWVFLAGARGRARVRDLVARCTGLRGTALRVVVLDELPVTTSGKPDDAPLRAHVERAEALGTAGTASADGPVTAEDVRDLYAVALGRPDATVESTFVALGGDSLSYVEISTRLGERLGPLPSGWPSMSAAALAAAGGPAAGAATGVAGGGPERARRRPRGVPVDVSVLLRALAIVLVVVAHADVLQVQGGAHVLLAVAGFNLARFQLAVPGRAERVRAVLGGARAIALPTAVFVGVLALVGDQYRWSTALLLNGLVGADTWDDQWQLWFLEALVWSYVALALLLAVPAISRAQRAAPFGTALLVLALALGVRFWWTGVEAGATERYTPGVVAWCLALGACAAFARHAWQRWLVALLAVAATIGFFGDPRREAIVVAGVLLLIAGRPVRLPRRVAAALGALAAASLWIYLTHWQVYPPLEDAGHPVWAVVASLAVGLAAAALAARGGTVLRAARRRLRFAPQ